MRLWQKITCIGLVVILVVLGLRKLRLEADILATLPPQLPEVQGLKLLRDAFKGGDELVMCLETSDAIVAQEATESLGAFLEKQVDLVKSVRWAGTFDSPDTAGALLSWAVQNASPEKVAALRGRLEADKLPAHLEGVLETLASSPDPAVVQRWSYDPLGFLECLDLSSMNSLQDSGFDTASADGTFRLMFVAPKEKVTGYKEAGVWLDEIRAKVEEWKTQNVAFKNVTLLYTGEPAFLAETGAGIEKDMKSTIGMTEVLITILFWVMFRRLKPLLWIQLLLAFIMLLTVAFSSLLMGHISVMSLGFASIVLGIVVDYAVLILQEAKDHPQLSVQELRRRAGPGIAAGAGTTSAVFLSLLFSGLPGLADLGALVALGVIVGLVVMVGLMPYFVAGKIGKTEPVRVSSGPPVKHGFAIAGTIFIIGSIAGILIWRGIPQYQSGSEALRPSKSGAITAWDVLQQRLGKENQASVPMLVTGKGVELNQHLVALQTSLEAAKREGLILGYALPTGFIPDLEAQKSNRETIEWIAKEQTRLQENVLAAGFTEESLALFQRSMKSWATSLQNPWPMNPSASGAADVLGRFMGDDSTNSGSTLAPGETVLLGSVTLIGDPGTPDAASLQRLRERLEPLTFVHLTGWESLGSALSKLVKGEITRLTLPLLAVLAIMLTLTFRNGVDILLSIMLISLGIGALFATMAIAGVKWNLASLAALPLLVGTGIDYGIHIMLALARENNDIRRVRATTARAVFFSGATTVIGFSSLTFAGNKGIASLGLACCVGTAWIMLFVLWLLPHWRVWLKGKTRV